MSINQQQKHHTSVPRRIFIVTGAIATATLAISLFAQSPTLSSRQSSRVAAEGEPSLADVRAATKRFQDVKVALAEGYMRDPSGMCVTPAMEGLPRQLGEMGVHYFRPDLLGITAPPNPRVNGNGTHTDFQKPGVLIYEPQADGSLKLVAVENLVFEKAWREAGHTELPEYAGQQYYHMVDNPLTQADEAHGFEPHYELHMWLYRENPNGMFAQFNPRATCANNKVAEQHEHEGAM